MAAEGQQAGQGANGGWNLSPIKGKEAECFAPYPLNVEAVDARGGDDRERVFWKLKQCECVLWKSRHSVKESMRAARRAGLSWPNALVCPFHSKDREARASKAQRKAFSYVLVPFARQLHRPCTIVWEAKVVPHAVLPNAGAFDFWLREWMILVEVDGEQHTCDMHSTTGTEQAMRDRRKEQAAVDLGYHVVRLDVHDMSQWRKLFQSAFDAVFANPLGDARVHYSPYNVPPQPVVQRRPTLTFHSSSGW